LSALACEAKTKSNPSTAAISKDPTMHDSPLTEVQDVNLRTLILIRVGLERDSVDTCRMFALDRSTADQLRTMPLDRLWTLVHAVGPVSLFVARDDLGRLLASPPCVAGPLAAAHAARPSRDFPQA
jgi:hypothetical protein